MVDSKIINWEKVFENSEYFKNNKPFNFGYVEEFFDQKFYDELYKSYPKIDDTWGLRNTMFKYQYGKEIFLEQETDQIELKKREVDPSLGEVWIKLGNYIQTEEFLNNFTRYTGIPNLQVKQFQFMAYKQGGFQLPHAHNIGPSTLHCMTYYSKGWKKGDPGGTFMSENDEESSIIFEPHNLDNTMAIFHDGPNSWHGARYIEKDVVRQAVSIVLEEYSPKTGWTGGVDKAVQNIQGTLSE